MSAAHSEVMLPIPSRLQWKEENGYCGETALQCSGLYYGQYVSVGKIRAAHGDGSNDGDNQLLIGNEEQDIKLVKALKMTCNEWNSESEKQPQYEKHLIWIKQHLRAHYPTILCVYVHEESDDDYDHIMLAVGVDSHDAIIYQDFFEKKLLKSPFPLYSGSGKVPHDDGVVATRKHASNQSHSYYALPRDACYSLSITGLADPDHVLKRVRMTIDNDKEPNYLYKKEKPIQLHATLTISELIVGHTYALLSYSDMKHVPIRDFLKQKHDRRMVFKADHETEIIKDSVPFLSSESRLYRCIEVPPDTQPLNDTSSISIITSGQSTSQHTHPIATRTAPPHDADDTVCSACIML